MTKRNDERTQFLADVLTTAVDGGINYWAAVSDYVWTWEHPSVTRVTVHEMTDETGDYKMPGVLVTLDTIASAIAAIRKDRDAKFMHASYRAIILRASDTNDAGTQFDADTADLVMQVAVLGDVIYG